MSQNDQKTDILNVYTPSNTIECIFDSVNDHTASFFEFTRSTPAHTFKRNKKRLSMRLHAFLTSLVSLGNELAIASTTLSHSLS